MSMRAIVAHWSVTGYKATPECKDHYHFTVEEDGNIVAGNKTPEDNLSTVDGKYAAHTKNFNTGVIGIACAAMMGAESVTKVGKYPITERQFKAMCKEMARLCKKYGIPVSPKTTLTHAEVQGNLGIKQNGKWDIAVLPYAKLTTAKAVGDYMRQLITEYLK